MLNGLTQLNVELTSRCDKSTLCAFCGHQDPAIYPTIRFGEMSLSLLRVIARHVTALGRGLVVQFHRDGDPLAYPALGPILQAFWQNLRSIVTHGERLAERADEIIDQCESVCVSIFRGDPSRERQLTALREFLKVKGDKLPRVFVKVVGDMTDDELRPYTDLSLPVLRRAIHTPMGNAKYAHRVPTMPEHGVCLDLLHHPSIAWDGRVYLCNRLDTKDAGLIGNLTEESLESIWNGKLRADYLQKHLDGRRDLVPPCQDCKYYGVPTA